MSDVHILVVDDEHSIRELLTILLSQEGYTVSTAESVASALSQLADTHFDLVICDLKLPDGNGLSVLQEALQRNLSNQFIIITAHTTPQQALASLRAGAVEYLSKPFDVEDLKALVKKHLPSRREAAPSYSIPEFIGKSPAITRILSMVPRVASTPSSVLITGESGTGKELLAQAIHAASDFARGPFVSVNCGALPEGLLESELFGHTRGSFTGAIRDHSGLFAQASSGTIFLDEVGELPPMTQVKLLRALQEHKIRPVGGDREISIDVRVIAATNRDLSQDVQDGRYREDLFYRLNVINLHLPPLRHRPEDIPDLARHFVEQTCERFSAKLKRLAPDAVAVLLAYSWPGNVRELENIIERTVALEQTDLISAGSLPVHLHGAKDTAALDPACLPEEGIDLEEYLTGLRRSLMQQAMARTEGHRKHAAKLLRLSYRAFRYHADKLGLSHGEEKKE